MNTDEYKDKATLEKQWLDELQNSKEIQKYLNGEPEDLNFYLFPVSHPKQAN